MLERLVEENATVAIDGKSIVYALTKETLCKPDSDDDDRLQRPLLTEIERKWSVGKGR